MRPSNNFSNHEVTWSEATEDNKCFVCGAKKWCFLASNGKAAVCRHTDTAPAGWFKVKNAKDDYPIFVQEDALTCTRANFRVTRRGENFISQNCDRNGVTKDLSTPVTPNLRASKQQPAPIQPDTKIATLVEPATNSPQTAQVRQLPKPLFGKVPADAMETVYSYSQNQWVVRYQWENPEKEKGYEKTYRQFHRREDGMVIMQKGQSPWRAYQLDEVLAAIKDFVGTPAVLLQEGEKVVELARGNALVSFTFQGSSWSRENIKPSLQEIKDVCQQTLIIFLHDGDQAGIKKAETLSQCCAELGLACLLVNPRQICPELERDSDDLEQILASMDVNEFTRKLSEEIRTAVDAREVEAALTEYYASQKENVADNPESDYEPICEALDVPFEDCATAQTFDGWAYRNLFGGNKKEWMVLNSAFYKWSEQTKIWEHQTDSKVYAEVANAGQKAFRLTFNKHFGWQVKKPYESNSHKESAFKYSRSRLEQSEELPANTHLLAFLNCVVDLRTGEKIAHSKDQYLTNLIPYNYEPGKDCPEVFRQFIADSFGEDLLDIIRAFTSMFLDPTAPYGRFPHLIGQSGGGKGTLGRFWSSLFGEEGSGSAAVFADISTPEGRHQYLTGKRIFGFPDVGGFAQGVRAFYELVDNGSMSGRALFNPVAYSKQWYVRFWVASVDHLQVENAGDGWARRDYPIPTKFRTVEPDPYLSQKLEAIKADVISWALAMPRAERDAILLLPPTNERVINLALDAAVHGDSAKSFVDLCLRPDANATYVPNHLLHSWYEVYCLQHRYHPLGMSKFISHLKTVLPRNHVERRWSPMVKGKRKHVEAHWAFLAPIPGLFVNHSESANGYGNSIVELNPTWTCIKAKCIEGGLMEFDDFWNPPSPPDDDCDNGGGHNDDGGNNPPNQPFPNGGLALQNPGFNHANGEYSDVAINQQLTLFQESSHTNTVKGVQGLHTMSKVLDTNHSAPVQPVQSVHTQSVATKVNSNQQSSTSSNSPSTKPNTKVGQTLDSRDNKGSSFFDEFLAPKPKFAVGDKCEYVGSNPIFRDQYGTSLLVVVEVNYGKVSCWMSNVGGLTTWLEPSDLRKVNSN